MTEIASAVEHFDRRHWHRRREEAREEHGRYPPEWLLGPDHSKLEPHFRVVRQRLLEIPDAAVVTNIRDCVNLMHNHEEAVRYGPVSWIRRTWESGRSA